MNPEACETCGYVVSVYKGGRCVTDACLICALETRAKERDSARKEVERLKAEAEALQKRVRILEIAPKAAWWANDKLGCGVLITDADNAARVIAGVGANATDDWAKAVLEYAAREGLT